VRNLHEGTRHEGAAGEVPLVATRQVSTGIESDSTTNSREEFPPPGRAAARRRPTLDGWFVRHACGVGSEYGGAKEAVVDHRPDEHLGFLRVVPPQGPEVLLAAAARLSPR
jgi:hypothetical protein